MTENQKNDLFYVCSMIEYVARKTKNPKLPQLCFLYIIRRNEK